MSSWKPANNALQLSAGGSDRAELAPPPAPAAAERGRWTDMFRIRALFAIALAGLVTANPFALLDKDCAPELPLPELTATAQAIALGEIEQIASGHILCDDTLTLTGDLPQAGLCYKGSWFRVTFKVRKTLKGSIPKQVEIFVTGRILDLAHCNDEPEFHIGGSALVFLTSVGGVYKLLPGRTGIIYPQPNTADDLVKTIKSTLHGSD